MTTTNGRDLTMGDIGEPLRRIEFEPMPDSEPIREPAPVPAKEPVPC